MNDAKQLDFPDLYATWNALDIWYRAARFEVLLRLAFTVAFGVAVWAWMTLPGSSELPAEISSPVAAFSPFVTILLLLTVPVLCVVNFESIRTFVHCRQNLKDLTPQLDRMMASLEAGARTLTPEEITKFDERMRLERTFLEIDVRTWKRFSGLAVTAAAMAIFSFGLSPLVIGFVTVPAAVVLMRLVSAIRRLATVKVAQAYPARIGAV